MKLIPLLPDASHFLTWKEASVGKEQSGKGEVGGQSRGKVETSGVRGLEGYRLSSSVSSICTVTLHVATCRDRQGAGTETWVNETQSSPREVNQLARPLAMQMLYKPHK